MTDLDKMALDIVEQLPELPAWKKRDLQRIIKTVYRLGADETRLAIDEEATLG